MAETPMKAFEMTGTRIDDLVAYGLTEIVVPYSIPTPPIECASEQESSFADALRGKTKTGKQLRDERRGRCERQLQSNVRNVVDGVKRDCVQLANRGKRRLSKTYSIYTYEAGTILGGELILRHKTSSLVKEALLEEGFKTVSTSLRRCMSGKGYDLHVVVRW